MCGIFDPVTCAGVIVGGVNAVTGAAGDVASSAADGIFQAMADGVNAAVKWTITVLASWTLIPSTDLCPGTADGSAQFVAGCNSGAYPAAMLRSYVLPITVLVALAGIIWQGITMAVTRKGEPLLQVARGIFTTAAWGAVGIAGTQMVLKAGDAYSAWILGQALFSDNGPHTNQQLSEAFGTALGALLTTPAGAVAPFVAVIFGVVVLFAVLIQAIMMVFREGSMPILAGVLQLAAAGKFTQATSPWLPKVSGWLLALGTYKVMAASIYAVAFLMMSSPDKSGRNFLMGIAVLLLSVVALPALMKFFNWTVGSMTQHSGGLGMFGGGLAAGLHAGSSLRGVGGYSAAEHSRYMDTNGPGSATAGPAGPSGPTGPGGPGGSPGGGAPPKVIDGVVTSSGPAQAGASPMAATSVPSGTGAAAGTAAGGSAAGSAAAGGATGAGAATTAGVGASAATGPAAPVVAGVVVAASAGVQATRAAAGTVEQATEG